MARCETSRRGDAGGREHRWVVVLAAGSGRRVSELTGGVPKQYYPFRDGPTLLRRALRRAQAVVPLSRIVVVVAAEHRSYWSRELHDVPADNVIIQPRDKGTGVGVLLPCLRVILGRDPGAHFLVLPSDHHVSHEGLLEPCLVAACDAAQGPGRPLVLLGMAPEEPDDEYGWIVPGPQSEGPVRPVSAFVEKPRAAVAAELIRRGALINAFVFASEGALLLRLYEAALPHVLGPLIDALRRSAGMRGLSKLYEVIPAADFSRDLLERGTGLSVMTAPPCGWSDLGTPRRLDRFHRERGRDRVGFPATAKENVCSPE